MPVYLWSQTAASNATSDPTINWAEGQAPSSVNDSGRAVNAAIKKYVDDISGAIVTGGSATAYTVTSYSVFDTLAHMNGAMVAFTPHATNGATVTLNVDGLGAKALRSSPNVELLAGTLIQGTPYTALYNNSDAVWYLHGFYSNAYNIPLGGGLPFFGTTAPNSSFVFPYGQAISRTTYSALFTMFSTTYGAGDGSTTFNVPDLRGRVLAGKDDMGGSASSRLGSGSGFSSGGALPTTLGAVGGLETHTNTLAQLPTGITSRNATQAISVAGPTGHTMQIDGTDVSASLGGGSTHLSANGGIGVTATFAAANDITVTSNNTSGSAHNNVQPTIITNYIIRII